jgi:hypothetical protein
MSNSKNITVTQFRGYKAFMDMFDASDTVLNGSDSQTSKADEKLESTKIRVGEVLRFYPATDKVLVKFNDNTTERCVESHLVVSGEVNVSFTPVGDASVDTTYNEQCIIPVNKFYAIVLNIRDSDNKKENCVIGYISKDNQLILNNAYTGELKLQYYDSSIILNQDSITIKSDNVTINGNDALTTDTKDYYSKTEVDTLIKGLNDRLTVLENNGGGT